MSRSQRQYSALRQTTAVLSATGRYLKLACAFSSRGVSAMLAVAAALLACATTGAGAVEIAAGVARDMLAGGAADDAVACAAVPATLRISCNTSMDRIRLLHLTPPHMNSSRKRNNLFACTASVSNGHQNT